MARQTVATAARPARTRGARPLSGEAFYVLGVTALALILFVTEIVSVDVVGIVVMVLLVLGGVLTPAEGMGGFSNEALITIACMFALSAGLIRAGALDALGGVMDRLSGGRKGPMVVATLLAVALSSAFLNNTPVAVIFLPVMLGMAGRFDMAPSRLLIPMSYASILGGTCTLIGTSTNLLVSEVAHEHGFPAIGVFEFSKAGVLFAILGFAYMATVGRKLLPRRASVSSAVSAGRIREFVTEVLFPADSPFVGRSYQDVLGRFGGITPLMLIRGDEVFFAPLIANPQTQFVRAGDVLLLKGGPGAINAMLERDGVTLTPELGALMARQGAGRTVTMVELVINPNSPLIGRTIAGSGFSRRYGNAAVVAVLRRDEHLRRRVSGIRLRLGDTLLVVCGENELGTLRNTEEFILLEGVERHMVRRDKAPLAVGIMALVVALAAIQQTVPLSMLAMTGVTVMLLTGCLSPRLVYTSVDWSIIVLIGGMLALGHALEKVGLVHHLSSGMLELLRDFGPVAVMAGIYLLSAVLTSLVTNNAVAVLLTPVALDVAGTMGYAPAPFLFAVLFGASACFATPVGYQTNLFVYGPGGYRFTDYVRVGLPLNVLLFIAAVIVIPWFWPLRLLAS